MSKGNSYVPGGFALKRVYQSSDYTIVMVYRNKAGKEYRRMVQSQEKGWPHAKRMLKAYK